MFPPVSTTLFAQQMGDEFHLILNSEIGQWGPVLQPRT